MNNVKNDEYYVQKILKDLCFISDHMIGVSKDDLDADEVLMDSMCFRLIQVQENAKKLSEAYKLAHDDVEWRDIAGLRNYIVHDYGNVDITILFDTLTKDIPILIESLE